MEKFIGKNGTLFAFDPKLEVPILLIEGGQDAETATKVTQFDASDLLEFAEFLFDKGKYESVARLRIKAGDVVLVRTAPGLSIEQLHKVEASVKKDILEPLGLADSVAVVSLDGGLDIEVVERG